jgi:hypothetical protein
MNQKSHPAIGAAFLIYSYDIPGRKLRFLWGKSADRAQKTGQACALSSFL